MEYKIYAFTKAGPLHYKTLPPKHDFSKLPATRSILSADAISKLQLLRPKEVVPARKPTTLPKIICGCQRLYKPYLSQPAWLVAYYSVLYEI